MERNVVIATGGTASEAVELPVRVAKGTFQVPAAITGTTVQPRMSNDGANWTNVDSAISVSANVTYAIPAACFGAKYLSLLSNQTEAAARTFKLFLRE